MSEKVMVIGIAGGSGSGKTTLAHNIISHFGTELSVLRHDDYYRSQKDIAPEERPTLNYDHPAAFETDLLIRHIDELKAGRAVDCPIYDYTVHDRSEATRRVESTPVILLEGILIFENLELLMIISLIIVVFRELAITAIRMVATSSSGVVLAANMLGKVKTVTQIVAISTVLLEPVVQQEPRVLL